LILMNFMFLCTYVGITAFLFTFVDGYSTFQLKSDNVSV